MTTMPTGVNCRTKSNGEKYYIARAKVNGKLKYLGTFDSATEASEAFKKFRHLQKLNREHEYRVEAKRRAKKEKIAVRKAKVAKRKEEIAKSIVQVPRFDYEARLLTLKAIWYRITAA
jgi:hypothetical protein